MIKGFDDVTADEENILKLNGSTYMDFIKKLNEFIKNSTFIIEKKIIFNDRSSILNSIKCILNTAKTVFTSEYDPFYLLLIKFHKDDQISLSESIYASSKYLKMMNVSSKLKIGPNENLKESLNSNSQQIETDISQELKVFGSITWAFFNMFGAIIHGIAHPKCMRMFIREMYDAIPNSIN